MALKLADYVVTEAGFASDLGFQKFCDIVCRTGGFAPSAAVLVTTVRATKSHGGKPFAELGNEDLDALRRGADNLAAHVNIVRQYGIPCVVSINNFPTDTDAEVELIEELATEAGAETVVVNRAFAQGGDGAIELANAVVAACERPSTFSYLHTRRTPARGSNRSDRHAVLRRRQASTYPVPGGERPRAHRTSSASGHGPHAHGQDPLVAVSHDALLEPPDRLHSARFGDPWSPALGPGSSSPSAETCSACLGSAGHPPS